MHGDLKILRFLLLLRVLFKIVKLSCELENVLLFLNRYKFNHSVKRGEMSEKHAKTTNLTQKLINVHNC